MPLERFPMQVRRATFALFGQPPATVQSRTGVERKRLRDFKLTKIRFLEDYFISRAVARVSIALQWQHQFPFCLFLRSFAMGHLSILTDEEEWLERSEPAGGRLLRPLCRTLNERAALVAVASPSEWLPNRLIEGPFINLVLDDAGWHRVVKVLIRAADVIVIHRADASPGVDRELEAIRATGRTDSTIVVREPRASGDLEPPSNASPLESMGFIRRRLREARENARRGLFAFPHDAALAGCRVLEWRDDERLLTELAQAVTQFLDRGSKRRRFDRLPSIEPPTAPAGERERYLVDARHAHELAGRCLEAKDFVMAEEFLFECFATSCAAEDVGGRASACQELGRLFLLHMRDAQSALIPLEYALGHFSTCEANDRALETAHLLAAAHLMSSNASAARAIVEEAEKLPQDERHRRWQRNLWKAMEAWAPDDRVSQFARTLPCRTADIV